jgi:hypothetical protein
MKLTKLNFVGEAAKSKEFRNNQIAKAVKVKYGTYTFPVPIGQYNDIAMERVFTSLINVFSNQDVRVLVEDAKGEDGFRKSTTEMTIHLLPPMTEEEQERASFVSLEQSQHMKDLEAKRDAQIKRGKAKLKREAKARADSKKLSGDTKSAKTKKAKVALEEDEKPKKKAKKKKTPRKRVKKNA